jgi:Gram-negative bacterial TonB protein C-terminal
VCEKCVRAENTQFLRSVFCLAFDVNEYGVPVNIQIVTTSDESWAQAVVTALRGWQFTPGHKDGGATSVPIRMDFVRDN